MDKLSTYGFPRGGIRCYYYTASVENALDIIRCNHLFGSLPSKVNDPDDLRITISDISASPLLIATGLNGQEIEDRINETFGKKNIMDRVYRFVCFAVADRVDKDKRSEIRFWNEYADNFSGVRFTFQVDGNFLIAPKPDETFCGMISYNGHVAKIDASNYSTIYDINPQITSESFLLDLCYSKSPKWANEYELRLGSVYSRLNLEMSQKTSKEERFFTFAPAALKEVVVGYRASDCDVALLEFETNNRNVTLQRADINLQFDTI